MKLKFVENNKTPDKFTFFDLDHKDVVRSTKTGNIYLVVKSVNVQGLLNLSVKTPDYINNLQREDWYHSPRFVKLRTGDMLEIL